jgi:hypothetical protein
MGMSGGRRYPESKHELKLIKTEGLRLEKFTTVLAIRFSKGQSFFLFLPGS